MGTATSVLKCQTRYEWLGPINCTMGSVPFGEFGSNPNITGIGVSLLDKNVCGHGIIGTDRLFVSADRSVLRPNDWTFPPYMLSRPDLVRPFETSYMAKVTRTSSRELR